MNAEKKNKRVVFTMGGKGGVGKTGLMVALAEWFEANEIPFTLLDLDTENKARGSLKHFFNGSVAKVNIHTPAGLDAFVDHLESGAAIILADMGAGSGQVASDWFDAMYDDVSATGARFWNRSHHGAWHLYGHSHGNLPDTPTSLSMDVGVDTHDFQPWHFDEINLLMTEKASG
jgi:hypothetical protein